MDPFYQPDGIQQFQYVGDSLFEGALCQHIVADLYLYDTTGALHHSGPESRFTKVTAGGAVEWYNTDVPGFDTLAWFGGPPGASWTLHYSFNQDKLITVEDTGSLEVNGLWLRYLVISSSPPAFSFENDTIFERVGALMLHNFYPLTSYFIESPTLNGLGCYRDDAFSLVLNGMGCDIPLAIPESTKKINSFTPYPNPGNNYIIFNLSHDLLPAQLMIFNMRGILLRDEEVYKGIKLDVSDFALGPYYIVISDRNNTLHQARWIKIDQR